MVKVFKPFPHCENILILKSSGEVLSVKVEENGKKEDEEC